MKSPGRAALSTMVVVTGSIVASAHLDEPSSGSPPGRYVTAPARLEAITRAQVWSPTNVASMDIKAGPPGVGAFAPGETVTCDYIDTKMRGKSPKFTCLLRPDDQLIVKYGRQNGEVYAEVAATRLLWALGFGANRVYPVGVVCRGCPERVQDTSVASIQRTMAGNDIETADVTGWAWPELDRVDPGAGGAPRAHRDALKLLAVFMQHTDSKPEQQRIVCLDKPGSTEGQTCAHPFMMMHDVGLTFGSANRFNRDNAGSVNLEGWSKRRIWKDSTGCVANLPKSMTGSLEHPGITEEGRKFLADLLQQLTDAQLGDLFSMARFAQRTEVKQDPGAVTMRWVEAFHRKRDDIVQRRCQ